LQEHRELALRGIRMRKLGQELIRVTAGKRIHGISAVPGGIHKHLSEQERAFFFRGDEVPTPLQAADQLEELFDFLADYHRKHRGWIDDFAAFPSNHLSLVGPGGGMDLYHGRLRAIAADGSRLLDDVDYEDYLDHLGEEVRSWTWLKFPFLRSLGPEAGWVRVGPLARLNVCDFIPTPRAQAALERYRSFAGERVVHRSLFYHWARLVEMLHCAELIDQLLRDPALGEGELVRSGTRRREGVGVVEAPRGTLLHHYEVDEDDAIRRCNLIVSTTHNNEAMNRAVRDVAVQRLTGAVEISEGMLNEIEVAIRAFDPCLSCATHAVGQMPLHVSVHDVAGTELARRVKA
jgi:NAD-reducing hydrogenase large subunit